MYSIKLAGSKHLIAFYQYALIRWVMIRHYSICLSQFSTWIQEGTHRDSNLDILSQKQWRYQLGLTPLTKYFLIRPNTYIWPIRICQSVCDNVLQVYFWKKNILLTIQNVWKKPVKQKTIQYYNKNCTCVLFLRLHF